MQVFDALGAGTEIMSMEVTMSSLVSRRSGGRRILDSSSLLTRLATVVKDLGLLSLASRANAVNQLSYRWVQIASFFVILWTK